MKTRIVLKIVTLSIVLCQLTFFICYLYKYNRNDHISTVKSTSKSLEQSFNLTRIGYIINTHCNYPPQLLLVVIISSPENALRRDDLRNSWAKSDNFSVVFFVGRTQNESVDENVTTEAKLTGDLVILDFADSYRNLSLKTVLMLRWVRDFCNHVKFMLKADDDVFINVNRLLEFVRSADNSVIYGRLAQEWVVLRANDSKWMVTEEEFPDAVYPDYVTGPAYLIGTNVGLEKLISVCIKQPILYLEDAFVTGVCAAKSQIKRVSHSGFVNVGVADNRCELLRAIAWHRIYAPELRRFSNYVTDSGFVEACRTELRVVIVNFLPPLLA